MARVCACLLTCLAAASALVCVAGGSVLLAARPRVAPHPLAPETVTVPAGAFTHRLDGDYTRDGRPVDAPRAEVRIDRAFEIMRHQVTAADYGRCVAAVACKATDRPDARADYPATGISHADATAYAAWLSAATGQVWRLPTDVEWARAAGSRFVDDAAGYDTDAVNPAVRWLAEYDREAAAKAARDPAPQPLGQFGANEFGVADVAGNVWEWTSTCLRRVTLDAAGAALAENRTCGIYVVEGRHRAAMSFFIRNPKSGGCSVGTPPDNLGFRLVRERRWYERLVS